MKHKTRTKALSWLLSLALALSLVPGMGLTAQATPAETLLTTITPTDQTTYSATTSGVVTVSHNNDKYSGQYGWQWGQAVDTLTVSGCEGYTITKVIFKQNEKNPVTDSSAPFELHFVTGKMRPVECQEDTEFDGVTSIEVYGYSNHTHSFTYSASGATITATCGAEGCKLPDDGNGNHTATLTIKPPANLVYDNKAKAATVEGTIPGVETPSIKYIGRGGTTYESTDAPTEMGDYTASVTLTNVKTGENQTGNVSASVDFTIKDAEYTIYIPATLPVKNAGWNATAGITAKGEIAEDKKLTVTASSDDEFAMVKGEDKILYKLAESGDSTTTYAGATEKTVWDFSVDELAEQGGTTKPMGAVVEEYINKPAGDYTDTVTFTAKVAYSPRTYHELKSGDVLRVGDTVDAPNTEYRFSNVNDSFYTHSTYTLLRADITEKHPLSFTEKDDGEYYFFKYLTRVEGYTDYTATTDAYDNFIRLTFKATDTSDGLVITQSGGSWNIAVHEPEP